MTLSKGRFIAKLFKISGIIIVLAGIAAAIGISNMLDVSTIQGDNDFFNAILRSNAVIGFFEKIRLIATLAAVGFGLCFGLLSFGIGVVLTAIKQGRP